MLFSKIFNWWKAGLLAWLPENLQLARKQKSQLQCTVDDNILSLYALDKTGLQADQISVVLNLEESVEALADWLKPYQNYDVILLLNDEQYLVTALTMPARAKEDLAKMIQFEVDRQTPFSVDQVYSGYQFNGVQSEGKISVNLAVVPKHIIAKLVKYLADASCKINTLLIDKSSYKIEIALSASEAPASAWSQLNYWLSGLAVILLFAVLYKPVVYYENALEGLHTPLAAAKKQAQKIHQLNAENVAIIKRVQFLDNKLTNYRSRTALINELARVLPSHTWLEQLTVRDSLLTIQGESASASDLIGLLTHSDYFTEVRFNAPITTDARTAKDRFKIQATIEPQH